MKTFYLVKYYLSEGLIEAQATGLEGRECVEVAWGDECFDFVKPEFVKPEKDGSFDKTKALFLAKELVERKLKSIEKQKKKLEQQKVELEKELEEIAQ